MKCTVDCLKSLIHSGLFAEGPNLLWHLLGGVILQVFGLVVVRGHFQQPLVLNLDNLHKIVITVSEAYE